MAHGQELMVSVKLRIITKGLVVLLFAVSCLFGKGKNREGEKDDTRKSGDSKKVGKRCCELSAP